MEWGRVDHCGKDPLKSFQLLPVVVAGCGPPIELEADEAEPELLFSSVEQGIVSCGTRQDTGYSNGNAFTITVVTADGKPVEQDTANAYGFRRTVPSEPWHWEWWGGGPGGGPCGMTASNCTRGEADGCGGFRLRLRGSSVQRHLLSGHRLH